MTGGGSDFSFVGVLSTETKNNAVHCSCFQWELANSCKSFLERPLTTNFGLASFWFWN